MIKDSKNSLDSFYYQNAKSSKYRCFKFCVQRLDKFVAIDDGSCGDQVIHAGVVLL